MSRPRGQRVTVRDLAAETGVSIATVSRVLNNAAHVAPHTRELVQRAADRLSEQAPGPRTAPARVTQGPVYLRCPYLLTDYFGLIVSSIAETLELHGRPLLLNAGEAAQQAEVLPALAVPARHQRRDHRSCRRSPASSWWTCGPADSPSSWWIRAPRCRATSPPCRRRTSPAPAASARTWPTWDTGASALSRARTTGSRATRAWPGTRPPWRMSACCPIPGWPAAASRPRSSATTPPANCSTCPAPHRAHRIQRQGRRRRPGRGRTARTARTRGPLGRRLRRHRPRPGHPAPAHNRPSAAAGNGPPRRQPPHPPHGAPAARRTARRTGHRTSHPRLHRPSFAQITPTKKIKPANPSSRTDPALRVPRQHSLTSGSTLPAVHISFTIAEYRVEEAGDQFHLAVQACLRDVLKALFAAPGRPLLLCDGPRIQ